MKKRLTKQSRGIPRRGSRIEIKDEGNLSGGLVQETGRRRGREGENIVMSRWNCIVELRQSVDNYALVVYRTLQLLICLNVITHTTQI